MTDIFFSYSSKDRGRLEPVFEALTRLGFEVFWDQSVPPGKDWNSWIKDELSRARAAVVFWSIHSIHSPNVMHEATVARDQRKLIPVLIDPLNSSDLPLGHHSVQAIQLLEWRGQEGSAQWKKLQQQLEAQVMPVWVSRLVAGREAELVSERRRREHSETSEVAWKEQISDARDAQRSAELERNTLRAKLTDLNQQLSLSEQRLAEFRNLLDGEKKARAELEEALVRRQPRTHTTEAREPLLGEAWSTRIGVSVRLLILCLLVGVVMAALAITPYHLIERGQYLFQNITQLTVDTFQVASRYVLLGGVLVIPIWLVARTIIRLRRS